MRVIFMLGTKSYKNAERLRQTIDSVQIETYGTVREMMDNVTHRNLTFDRIVVSTASMHDVTTMEVLHRFLRDLHPRATVVYIFQHGQGETIANEFNNVFNSPLYTDVAVKTNSINLLEEITVGGIDTIRDKYSIRKYSEMSSDVIEDSYPEIDEPKEVKPSQSATSMPMLVLPQSKKQRKSTGLFGAKKLTKRDMEIINQNLRLVSDYMLYLSQHPDEVVKPPKSTLPQNVRKSMSNPVEEYKMQKVSDANKGITKKDNSKNQSNSVPSTTFTQMELGYYGFATSFDGRPMMFRAGISVSQIYNS